MEVLEFFLGLLGAIIGVALGGYILFIGRHALQVTLGLVGLVVTANLLAKFVANVEDAWDLFTAQAWGLIAIAVVIGVIGFVVGQRKPDTAALIIGFIAGADIAIWIYDISGHFITSVAKQSDQLALIVGLAIIAIGGLLGLGLVRTSKDEALILITMILGAKIIQSALELNLSSSWTAIFILTLALAGVLVQYALYLREAKGGLGEPEQHASSLAYFQNLELDL